MVDFFSGDMHKVAVNNKGDSFWSHEKEVGAKGNHMR